VLVWSNEICGYYNKGVYVQVIRSTTRRYFRWRQHGPAWKCIYRIYSIVSRPWL